MLWNVDWRFKERVDVGGNTRISLALSKFYRSDTRIFHWVKIHRDDIGFAIYCGYNRAMLARVSRPNPIALLDFAPEILRLAQGRI